MFNLILAQFKREYWQHKGALLGFPTLISGFSICALLAGCLYFSFGINKQIFVQSDGDIHISAISEERKLPEQLLNTTEHENLSDWQATDFNFAERHINKTSELSVIKDAYNKQARLYPSDGAFLSILSAITLIFVVITLTTSLASDRKDKSILVWRSLPVPESRNVLVKYVNAFIVLPVIYLVFTIATFAVMLAIFSVMVSIYSPVDNFMLTESLFVVLLTLAKTSLYLFVILAWFAPFIAWIAFCICIPSSWSWILIIIPFGLLNIAEKLILGSSYLIDTTKAYFIHIVDSINYLHQGKLALINTHYVLFATILTTLLIIATIYLRKYRID